MKPEIRRFLSGDLQVMMLGNAAESAMRFGAFVIYSSVLGEAAFGLVAATLALVHLTNQTAQFGIDTSVISLGSKQLGRGDEAGAARIAHAGLVMHVLVGFLLAAAGCAAAPWLARGYFEGRESVWTFVVAFSGIPVMRVANYSLAVLRTYQRFRHYAAASFVASAILLLAVVALWVGGRLSVAAVITLLLLVVPTVQLLASISGVPRQVFGGGLPGRATLLEIVRFGRWIWGTSLTETGVRRLNVLLLKSIIGLEAAGQFQVAVRYAEFLGLVFQPIRKYLVPKFTALDDTRQIADTLRKTYRWLAWTLLLLPAAWLTAPVIVWIQGPGYAASVPLFRILVGARLSLLLSKPVAFVLFSFHRPWVQTIVQALVFVLYLGSALVLIPDYGATGSAWCIFASSLATLVLLGAYVYRLLGQEASRPAEPTPPIR